MAKFTSSNRGSTKQNENGEWRTPKPLFWAIAAHYDVTFVLDAAADAQNALCPTFLTEEIDTLSLSLEQVCSWFRDGLRKVTQQTVHPIRHPAIFTNPDYNDGQIVRWMDLAGRFTTKYAIPWIFLIPGHRSEQAWWHRAIDFQPQVCYPKGRIGYDTHEGKPTVSGNHPSAILAFSAPPAGPYPLTSLSGEWREKR